MSNIETDSGFTTEGFKEVPTLYLDNNYTLHALAELPEKRLGELRELYDNFLGGDPMPHHKEQAERFLAHLDFEQRYRGGEFGEDSSV